MNLGSLALMSTVASLFCKVCWPIRHRFPTVSAFVPFQHKHYGHSLSQGSDSKVKFPLGLAASIQNRNSNSTAPIQSLTRSSVRRMKKADLIQELSARGLETHGLRDELFKRLISTLDGGRTSNVPSHTTEHVESKGIASNVPSHTTEHVESKASERMTMKFLPGGIYVLRLFGLSHHLEANAACGVIIYGYKTKKVVWSGRKYLCMEESAIEAEYIGLTETLQMIDNTGVSIKIVIQGDENGTFLKQLQGISKINQKNLQEKFEVLKDCMNNSSFDIAKIMGIPSEHNHKARLLAKKSIATHTSAGFDDPKTPSKTSATDSPVRISPKKVYVLQFDGGSRGNPGVSGAGMVLFDHESGLEVWSGFQFLDSATNNVAEYTALLTGLQCVRAIGVRQLIVQGDSQLVVNQITGKYKVKAENLQPIWRKAKSLSQEFEGFSINYIPRAENSRADALANKAMDECCSKGLDCLGVSSGEQTDGSENPQRINQVPF